MVVSFGLSTASAEEPESHEGEATASFLVDLLTDKGLRMTRIALGVPMGGDLKYMDAMTLQHALISRTPVKQ